MSNIHALCDNKWFAGKTRNAAHFLSSAPRNPPSAKTMDVNTWLLFLLTSVGLSLSPGPNGMLALTHGALYGRRKALFTIVGGVLGFIAVIGLCMFGIGALIKSSLVWLTALKLIGGAYLIWLGTQVWRSPPIAAAELGPAVQTRGFALLRQGFVSAITNPKGLLFFSAFLPQFLDAQHSLVVQFAAIAGTYAFTELLAEYAFASAAHSVRPWLNRVGKRFNHVCGGLFVAIGAALPLHT